MFERLTFICLLGMIVVSALGTEADAATCKAGYTYRCPTVGGTRCCGCWRTGSEICDAEVAGLGNIKNCVPGLNCPVVTCSVYGTVDLGDGLCDPNTLDPDCGIEGIAFGLTPVISSLTTTNHFRPKKRDCPEPQGQPLILDTPLTGSADIQKCDKNGLCQKSIELDISPDTQLTTFSATKFNGEICVCPGGFSTEGECCANIQRRIGGGCAKKGKEVCLAQQCTADLTGYVPGTDIPYTCTELPQQSHECSDHGPHH